MLLTRIRVALPLLSLAVVIALVVRAVLGNSAEFQRSLHLLEHPVPVFIALAILTEFGSYVSYAMAQQLLARGAGHRLQLYWLASLAVAAQALVDFLPAGYLAANVLNFRELRRRALPGALCAWLLGFTSLLYLGALLALASGGAVIDDHGGWIPRLLGGVGLLALAALVTVASGRLFGRRVAAWRRAPLAAIAWLERRQGIAARLAVSSRDVARQMAQARLTRREAAAAATLFCASWLLDAACLTNAFAALRISPPWNALLVGYAMAQLVSYLPVTPGGFGLVEGSLALTLTTSGHGLGEVLAAVLLYRGISYWGVLPAGALGYVVLRRAHSHRVT